MNPNHHKQKTALALALCSLIAQSSHARMYGKDAPFKLTDLPATNALRQHIEGLPALEQQHAMERLHSFSFPESDLNSIRLDKKGDVYYSDTKIPNPISNTSKTLANAAPITPSTLMALATVDTFQLHSRPGAKNTVFLDFDGHTVTGTSWNNTVASYFAMAFDLDNNPTNFSTDERNRIAEVWHRISEDFAPFDIDVTTELPTNFGPTVGRILFTKDTDVNGLAMPAKGAGGVAYVNVFGLSNYATAYSPAFVYYNNLGSGYAPYMAEAGAHEFGHNLGLSHDGVTDGTKNPNCLNAIEYYCGLGSGNGSWAPIMGVGYYSNVTEWSKGEYLSANNTQNDLNLIASKLQYRLDDNSNVFASATQLWVEPDGSVMVTNPENDPSNFDPVNKGVIETATDIDTFWFNAGAGNIILTVEPAWAAFKRTTTRGANLDIEVKLYDQSGTLIIANDKTNDTDAVISTTLPAGRYYLTVAGVGNSVAPYSNYGSLGEYFISGSMIPPAVDTTPPNPMTWSVAPTAQSSNSITMTASTAVDDSGIVQYQFQCINGGANCVNSAWQSSPNFVATGLAAGTSYSFSVVARDPSGNISLPSVVASAVTPSNQLPIAVNDSAILNEDTYAIVSVLANDNDPDGSSLTISAVGVASHGTALNNGMTIIYKPIANYNGSDSFTYTVSDGAGGTATATVTLTVKAINDAPIAKADTASVAIAKSVTINPLGNDTDVDGDVLTLSAVTTPKKGRITKTGNTLMYTAGTYSGIDTLTYTVSDGQGGSVKSSITVNIIK